MNTNKFDAKKLLKDKKFWFASFLIAWAAALQGAHDVVTEAGQVQAEIRNPRRKQRPKGTHKGLALVFNSSKNVGE
ncbi:unnamed protein product [Camellia sinensis]